MNSVNRRKIEIINKDIELIDKALESDDEAVVKDIHRTIDGKYQSCIANWEKSMYAHHLEYGFAYNNLGFCRMYGDEMQKEVHDCYIEED